MGCWGLIWWRTGLKLARAIGVGAVDVDGIVSFEEDEPHRNVANDFRDEDIDEAARCRFN